MSAWEPVIGLEVHVQLATRCKLFCRCGYRFGAEPNSQVCPICLGYPGTLPVVNGAAVDLALGLALALGCRLNDNSVFARKNYFYADLPKGYQISQFDRPLGEQGRLALTHSEREIRIHRLHLEEDAGKLLHEAPGGTTDGVTRVDFNRCGVPLVEIVSEPDLRSAAEAEDFLRTLHQLLLYTGASDGNLEEGSLRCDANVSLRRSGESRLGTKTEIKNLNSFRNVARAIDYEIERQAEQLDSGAAVVQETRGFDAGLGRTWPLRGKEEAEDYRYLPEPDLAPLSLAPDRIEALRARLPELPWARRKRFAAAFGLGVGEARDLTATPALADYFERAVGSRPSSARAVANWVRNDVLRVLRDRQLDLADALAPERLVDLVERVDAGEISATAARTVFDALWDSDESPADAIARLGLGQVTDERALASWVAQVVGDHPAQVAQFRDGKVSVLAFLVGQVMRRSGGRAEPRRVRELLLEALASTPSRAS